MQKGHCASAGMTPRSSLSFSFHPRPRWEKHHLAYDMNFTTKLDRLKTKVMMKKKKANMFCLSSTKHKAKVKHEASSAVLPSAVKLCRYGRIVDL